MPGNRIGVAMENRFAGKALLLGSGYAAEFTYHCVRGACCRVRSYSFADIAMQASRRSEFPLMDVLSVTSVSIS